MDCRDASASKNTMLHSSEGLDHSSKSMIFYVHLKLEHWLSMIGKKIGSAVSKHSTNFKVSALADQNLAANPKTVVL